MSYSERLSYGYIEQTCPKVDSLEIRCLELIQEDLDHNLTGLLSKEQIQSVGDLVEHRVSTLVGMIKEFATEPLRHALIDCCDDIKGFEDSKNEALNNLDKVESENSNLESDIEWYKLEINRLESYIYNLESKLGEI